VNVDGNLEFGVRVNTPSTQWISLIGKTVIQPGTWYHVYIAFSNSDKFEIWLDGSTEASNNGHIYGDLGKINTVPPLLTIAAQFENGDTTDIFYGSIDEVRIWDVYRDSVQRNSTKLDTLSSEYYSSPDSGLASYWRFDEFEDLGINGDGVDDVRDLSVWTRHGDSNGNPELVPSYLVSVDNSAVTIPFGFYLSSNYPNPFNPNTVISYQLPVGGDVILKIYDILGNEMTTLVDEYKPAGKYEVEFNAANLPSGVSARGGYASGVYFYQLKAGDPSTGSGQGFVETKKMLYLK